MEQSGLALNCLKPTSRRLAIQSALLSITYHSVEVLLFTQHHGWFTHRGTKFLFGETLKFNSKLHFIVEFI